MKNKKSNGFILLLTLLIISVISLLILASMQHILLYYKVINKQEELHQNFYQLESLVLRLAYKRTISEEQACVVHEDSANQVMHTLRYQRGCALNRGLSHYQYLIEDLGEFPCLVTYYRGRKRATHHQRISAVQIEGGTPASFLQIRFITTGGVPNCLTKERQIVLGMSSWRYFPYIS
ncbi:MAG: type II secretion system protein [Legionella longbeachae]|nr:type II secretion system protein [Legionella longbeachae]